MDDKKLVKWLVVIMFFPLALAFLGSDGEHYRYACQDPANWDKDICKPPICDVNRTCPEHVFKGQRDPRLGPPKDEPNKQTNQTNPNMAIGSTTQGVNCGR